MLSLGRGIEDVWLIVLVMCCDVVFGCVVVRVRLFRLLMVKGGVLVDYDCLNGGGESMVVNDWFFGDVVVVEFVKFWLFLFFFVMFLGMIKEGFLLSWEFGV